MFGFGGGNQVKVTVVGDASQLKREMGTAQKDVSGFAGKTEGRLSKMSGAVKGLLVAGAGAAIGNFVKSSITAFSDLNESVNAVEVVFGDASEGILRIGEDSVESFGMSQRAFNDFSVRFSAFAQQIAQKDGRDVVDVVDEMSTRVADFASVHNLSLERAAEVAQSTMAGETEVFRRFGGDVSAAAVEAKVLEEGIVGVGDAMTEQDKILGRYLLFMEQTEDMAGDFANTSDELAGSTKTLTAEFENFMAQLGEEFVPVAEEAIGKASNFISAWDEDVNLGWSQRLSAAFQTVMGDSAESVTAYIEQKAELNRLADAADDAAGMHVIFGGELNQIPAAAQSAKGGVDDLADAEGNLEDATDDATDAFEDQLAAHRAATDPVAATIRASRELRTAQDEYAQALRDGNPASEAAQEAALNLMEAQNDLDSALADIVNEGGPNWREEFRRVASQAGIADEAIEAMIASVLNADGKSATVDVSAIVTAPSFDYRRLPTGEYVPRKSGDRRFAQGGIIPARAGGVAINGLFAEAGQDEAIAPIDDLVGIIQQALGGLGGGGGMGDGDVVIMADLNGFQAEIGRIAKRELVRNQRQNGTSGVG